MDEEKYGAQGAAGWPPSPPILLGYRPAPGRTKWQRIRRGIFGHNRNGKRGLKMQVKISN